MSGATAQPNPPRAQWSPSPGRPDRGRATPLQLSGRPGRNHAENLGWYEFRLFLSAHHLLKGSLELGHLVLRANRDPHPGRHDRPDASHEHIFLRHRLANFLAGTLHLDHEAVRFRRNVGEAVAVEPSARLLMDTVVQPAALPNPRPSRHTAGDRAQ